MISDTEIAQLLVNLYSGPAGFDFYESGAGDSGICWALKCTPEADVVLLRGSKTLQDWFRDLIALASPWHHPVFGPVHPGFSIGMDRACDEIMSHLRELVPVIICGHSLGAGRAAILTALMIERGELPLARVAFGEPKPGFQQLADYIAKVPGRSYRNGAGVHHDMVTDVPFKIPPELYERPTPLIDVSEPPASVLAIEFDPFAFHHMPLYAAALAKQGR
jgi:hypothetical protein